MKKNIAIVVLVIVNLIFLLFGFLKTTDTIALTKKLEACQASNQALNEEIKKRDQMDSLALKAAEDAAQQAEKLFQESQERSRVDKKSN